MFLSSIVVDSIDCWCENVVETRGSARLCGSSSCDYYCCWYDERHVVVISFCLLLLLLASAVSQTVTKHKQHEYDMDAVKEESRVEKVAAVSEKKRKKKNVFHSFRTKKKNSRNQHRRQHRNQHQRRNQPHVVCCRNQLRVVLYRSVLLSFDFILFYDMFGVFNLLFICLECSCSKTCSTKERTSNCFMGFW